MQIWKQRIRELRKEKRLTHEDLGKLLNTTKQYYSRYETQNIELPLHHLITLCKFYEVSADYILGITDKRKKAGD